tara:strand:+ start:211 stop:618 length:408 start_codon:yes stop_codon:yes gene_type:complete
MGEWWLYVLVFVFGYLTHKTFYFFRSIRLSISLIRVSQLISLAVLAASTENFYYSHTNRIRRMKENDESEENIRKTRRAFNKEIAMYRDKGVKEILAQHPKFYDPIVPFDDWKSAMTYLEQNRTYVKQLIKQAEK